MTVLSDVVLSEVADVLLPDAEARLEKAIDSLTKPFLQNPSIKAHIAATYTIVGLLGRVEGACLVFFALGWLAHERQAQVDTECRDLENMLGERRGAVDNGH